MKSISSLVDRQKAVTWGSIKTAVIIKQEFHIVRKLMKSDFLWLRLTGDWIVHQSSQSFYAADYINNSVIYILEACGLSGSTKNFTFLH